MDDHQEIRAWITARLGRVPDHTDVFSSATQLYHAGDFPQCVRALRLYLTMPGHQANGQHLLGYALYMAGELPEALEALKQAVGRPGAAGSEFEADWQLLVQVQLELLAPAGSAPAPASSVLAGASAAELTAPVEL